MFGIEAITTKHVFTGDFAETCSCGHESISCWVDVVCTESADAYDIDVAVVVNFYCEVRVYFVPGEGAILCGGKTVTVVGDFTCPVSVGN